MTSGRTLKIPNSSRLSPKQNQDGLKVPIYSNHEQPYITLNLKKAEEKTQGSEKGLETWQTFSGLLQGAFKTKDEDSKDESTGLNK